MEVFIWHRICCVTDEYHNKGGLLIVGPDLEWAKDKARKLRNSHAHIPEHPMPLGRYLKPIGDVYGQCRELPEPLRMELANETVARVMVFPDKGCC